jgi:hypothetical protein
MIARPARICRNYLETQLAQLKAIYKYIDDPDRVIFIDEIVKAFWQKGCLRTALALDKSAHGQSPDQWLAAIIPRTEFSHSLCHETTLTPELVDL